MSTVPTSARAAPRNPHAEESSPGGSTATERLHAGRTPATWRAPELEGFDPLDLGVRRRTGPPDEMWILAMVMTMTTVVFLLLMNQ